MKKLTFIALFLVAAISGIHAQDSLALSDLLQIVRLYHPLTRSAALTPLKAQAVFRLAKGQFDPGIYYEQSQKKSGGSTYYNLGDARLEIPTRSPVKFEGGYESASGIYLNPQETLKGNNQYYSGLSANLLRDLITDKKRTLLRQSELMTEMSLYEQKLLLNDLGADVIGSFLDWMAAMRETAIYLRAVELTQSRLNALKQEIEMGARAEIDTLETSILVQNYSVLLRESQLRQIKARFQVNAHIWNEDLESPWLRQDLIPAEKGWDKLEQMVESHYDSGEIKRLMQNHPLLRSMELGVQTSRLGYQLKRQQVLPELNLKYHFISSNTPFDFSAPENNHRLGVTFSSPLYLRQARGEMAKAKFEYNSQQLKLTQKMRETHLKTMGLGEQVRISKQNYNTMLQVARGYEVLFETELLRSDAGESDLFLLNTRQMRMIDAEIKLVSMWYKMQKSKLDYLHQTGIIYNLLDLAI